jgi:acyl dehydratase
MNTADTAIAWTELPRLPSLASLYLRATLHRDSPRAELPNLGLHTVVAIDDAHLARYRALCGLPDDGRLPPLYPQVLAMPLQMALLTGRGFPIGPMGLVHLENRVRLLRPLERRASLSLRVWPAGLTPHDKGAVLRLLLRAEDAAGPLWQAEVRALKRGLRADGQPLPRDAADPALPIAPLSGWDAAAGIGRAYARASGDWNPIHLSAPSARLFGFPRAIAHGLWSKARALAALADRLPQAGVEIGVRFQRPVLLPARLQLSASAVAAQGRFALTGADGEAHLSGWWRPIG